MTEAIVWIKQSCSDLKAMDYLSKVGDEELYCQVISKAQQSIEKSVKALQLYMHGKGYQVKEKVNSHTVRPVLASLKRALLPHGISGKLLGLANIKNLGSLERLEALTPHHDCGRNTEYPYKNMAGNRTAPAEKGVFSDSEIVLYRDLAIRMTRGCSGIISTLERAPG